MTYQCINCKVYWTDEKGETDDVSHGLCVKCAKNKLIPYFRKKQLEEGNFDCFAKSKGYCDQQDCFYRKLCLS